MGGEERSESQTERWEGKGGLGARQRDGRGREVWEPDREMGGEGRSESQTESWEGKGGLRARQRDGRGREV